ncbi:hypothetical protein B0H11DRAFT_1914995 [Mycena galericulata]|nr:hypothetical protein B0H11DRAFT_1914995 [Mycena galericulata]
MSETHQGDTSPLPAPSKWGNASLIAQKAIETRVETHKRYLAKRGTENHVPPLVAMAVERLTESGCSTTDEIPTPILQTYIWSWHMMPYLVLYRSLLRLSREGVYACWESQNHLFEDAKIDEWILRNEKWLRSRDHSEWQHGMVTLNDAEIVFPNSVLHQSVRTLTRPQNLPGFKILGECREPQLRIQPSTGAFKRTFDFFSHGLLKNLDWNNVLVAGGMVLGTLLTVDRSLDADNRWAFSDIDLYIHGLTPSEANAKINHIFDIFRSNLPPQMRTLAVRNSTTITFYAEYPLRRVQVVLKLATSPRAVLLNFDLDICAMCWDGREVWMLPRAARALETGFNTFTMDLIQGHYLAERRASQPQRIFKYANKGYGIRFLPTYMSSLTRFEANGKDNVSPLNLPSLANKARMWTQERHTFITEELGFNRFNRSDLYRLEPHNPSPLSSFTSLMRHVAFWELAQSAGDRIVEDDWASTSYEDTLSQDNIPKYWYLSHFRWDESFSHAKLQAYIIQSNMEDIDLWYHADFGRRLQRYGIICSDQLNNAQRTTSASNAKDLQKQANDIRMPLILPCDFAEYANEVVSKAQFSLGLQALRILEPVVSTETGSNREGLFMWNIGSQLMWQHLDRQIDEVFEVLHAFRRANKELNEDLQLKIFTMALSRHNTRSRIQDEFEGFARWMGGFPTL